MRGDDGFREQAVNGFRERIERMLVAGCWLLVAGYLMLDTGTVRLRPLTADG